MMVMSFGVGSFHVSSSPGVVADIHVAFRKGHVAFV